MNFTVRVGSILLGALLFLLLGDTTRADDEKDALKAKSVWKGKIRQGADVFPATIYVNEREKDRIRGEVHFASGGKLPKLIFQGNVIEGGKVAWITDKKEGNVTFPGLYIGTIKGNTLSGIWQVPSAGQYDTFSVKLAE
jgi:hypothetical protein